MKTILLILFSLPSVTYGQTLVTSQEVSTSSVMTLSSDQTVTGAKTLSNAGNVFYGNGANLTGLTTTGDNLGNHIATTTLQMGSYGINISSNITGVSAIQFADGTVQVSSPSTSGGGGKLLQHVYTPYTSTTYVTTVVPFDDTIPQITEGTEIFTASITPTASGHTLRITALAYVAENVGQTVTCSIFEGTTANALSTYGKAIGANVLEPALVYHEYTTTGTSSLTFRLRCGPQTNGQLTINGINTARKYGGVLTSFITIDEISD